MPKLLLLCLLLGAPLAGLGQETRGGYVGASIGFLGHDFDGSVVSVDVISESLGASGGYRLNDHIAVEFGYIEKTGPVKRKKKKKRSKPVENLKKR